MKNKFACKIYGYDKKKVDNYLEDMKKDYEEELSKKRERMLELAEEVRNLKLKAREQSDRIEWLTEQEKYVSRALIKAEQRAQAIIEEGRQKSVYEMEQLKLEKEKWNGKFREIRQELISFENSLIKLIEKFRDDINYYSAKEISDTFLVDENNDNEKSGSCIEYYQRIDGRISEEGFVIEEKDASKKKEDKKEKVIA